MGNTSIICEDAIRFRIGNEKYELPFRKRIYTKCPTQDVAQVRRLQRSGVSLKSVDGTYYILSQTILTSLDERKEIISGLVAQYGENEKLLDIMATYYLAGYEGDNILDTTKLRRIKRYEGEHEPYQMQGRKSKDTACNRLFKLYSYEPQEQTEEFYWWNGEHVKPIGKDYRREGLINSCQPYMAQWILLSSTNDFKFGDKYYVVTAPQYLQGKADMVLCLQQNGRTYFFDEEVHRLAEEFVHERHNF